MGLQTLLRRMLSNSAEDMWIFLLLPAARQLHTLLVITVSGFFCLFAYALPSSFVRGNKNILSSLENFLCSDLKRLNSVPRELSGSWIKLCGKILYLLPCCHCGRCWISFYWLVNLSFCGSDIPKSPKFLPLCRIFLSSCNRRDQDLLLLLQSPASSEPQSFSFPRICPAPKSSLCQSRRFVIFLTLFSLTPSLEYACMFILHPEYLAYPNYSSG